MCSCVRSSTTVNIQSFSYLSELSRLLHTPGSLSEYESSDTELAEGGEKRERARTEQIEEEEEESEREKVMSPQKSLNKWTRTKAASAVCLVFVCVRLHSSGFVCTHLHTYVCVCLLCVCVHMFVAASLPL